MTKYSIAYNLPVSILKEGNRFVAYSPALDLSSSGKTFEEARSRFIEATDIFFEEIEEHGTLEEVLAELGWQKKRRTWSAPEVVSHESLELTRS